MLSVRKEQTGKIRHGGRSSNSINLYPDAGERKRDNPEFDMAIFIK